MPNAPRRDRLGKAVDWILAGAAVVLLASMLVAALHDMSRAFDVGYYHLPFAGRFGGVLPPDTYVFHRLNQARFEGFPLLAERLQGLLWRVTGRAESANLVAFASVPLFAAFLRRRFRVPFALGVLGLLAIPLVQLHATSAYVDLPANVAASVVVLLAIEAHAGTAAVRAGTLALALGAAAFAANTKFQTHPVVLVALAALAAKLGAPLVRATAAPLERARARRYLAVLALGLPLVFATSLRNTVLHHNPYYPVELRVLGHELPGPDAPYSSSPPWLEHAPRPVRFAASLLELGIRPLTSRRRWTVDQWMADPEGNRVGGFFHAYVVAQLALLALRLSVRSERRRRVVRAAAIGFALLTAITSVLPQSHELRYYLDWMLVLVALNLALACAPQEPAAAGALPFGRRVAALLGPRAAGVVALAALGVVLAVTRAGYAYPSGSSFAELVREQVDVRVLATVRDGECVCVLRAPWALLWASPFHPPRRYTVRESEAPSDCGGCRSLE